MPRSWSSVCALVALAALLVPPHACCWRFSFHSANKSCCCCANENDPADSHPAPSRQAPCCQKVDPATLAEKTSGSPGSVVPEPIPAPACRLQAQTSPAVVSVAAGSWSASLSGRRIHLLQCRFNC